MSRSLILVLWLCWMTAVSWMAAEAADTTAQVSRKPASVQKAIERALEFLAASQNVDGSWSSGTYQKHPAITGLAGMAFLSAGSTPREGPHARRVSRAVDFLVSLANPESGLIRAPGVEDPVMYGHGFATLFLAEACGMSDHPSLRSVVQRAVALIVASQHPDGGWRYEPMPAGESDLSITVCQVMALRAARNAGFHVPRGTVEAAVSYVRSSANSDGAFRYMLGQGQHTSFALTSSGLTALYTAGVYDAPELRRGLEYLRDFLRRNGYRSPDYFHYGHYYAAQAMFQAGPRYWDRYYRELCEELLAQQRDDGGWNSKQGDVFGTAMGAIMLQMPNQFLPIFER